MTNATLNNNKTIAMTEFKTDRDNSGFELTHYSDDKRIAIVHANKSSKDFERLEISAAISPVWLNITMDKVKNNRRNEISFEIDKKQAIALMEKLNEFISKMKD